MERRPIAFDGVRYLATEPETLEAGWAVNEGGKGSLDANGKPMSFGVQSGEKVYQDFKLVTTSSGGYSARPTEDNDDRLIDAALMRIREFKFPISLTPVSREFFKQSARLHDGQTRADLEAACTGPRMPRRSSASPKESALECLPAHDVHFDAHPRGALLNAQPQRAEANVNCRIMPGEPVVVHRQLQELVADPEVSLTLAARQDRSRPLPR